MVARNSPIVVNCDNETPETRDTPAIVVICDNETLETRATLSIVVSCDNETLETRATLSIVVNCDNESLEIRTPDLDVLKHCERVRGGKVASLVGTKTLRAC